MFYSIISVSYTHLIALAFAVDEMADPLRTDYCVTAFRCSVVLGGIYYYKDR